MARTQHEGKVRVGIAGLDHWYIGLDAARAAAAHPAVDLVVVAHRDEVRAQETARRFGAAEATADYGSVVRRADLDVVVTACRASDNAALCIEAAGRGLHLISVKPIATTREDAARIKDAVEQAGVHFFSWESLHRLSGQYAQLKDWIDGRRIGRLIAAAHVVRCSPPMQLWPGVTGQTWWLDPAHAPGGGWIDHAIYAVDTLRWLFEGEVVSATGTIATLVHDELPDGIEDAGLATLTFDGGQIASLDVTWTGAPGAHVATTHLVGAEGAIHLDRGQPSRASVSGHFDPFSGWSQVTLPRDDADPVAAMVAALHGGAPLPAGVADACRNLDACLTFYEAARAGRTMQVPSADPAPP